MDKVILKTQLLEKVKIELEKLEEVCLTQQVLVQSGDLKSDGKYDTRATEAGYLAGAQSKRLEELKLELQLLESIPTHSFQEDRDISIGDVVEIEFNKNIKKYYLCPTAGGSMITYDDEVLVVMSAFSLLGTEIIGLNPNDDFEVEVAGKTRHYKIIQAY